MEADFWHEKWQKNEIHFHGSAPNPLLVEHFASLSLSKGGRVFVPLCGKSLDIHWLLANGYRVAGAELSKIAIEQLFTELKLKPEIAAVGAMIRYSAPNIDIFVGDIFTLTHEILGSADGIYDRAALVALPAEMRTKYTAHLVEITKNAPQLLICFEYDQTIANGPPFSINSAEVHRHYQKTYDIAQLASVDFSGGLKGVCPATENVWQLRKK